MSTYRVVRFHRDETHPEHGREIKTGLTLEEAQEWCQDEATHGYDQNGEVVWFDGYYEEER